MRSVIMSTKKNRSQVWVAASVLLVAALVIPQLALADHASDHPYGQFDDPSINSSSDAYAALVENYETGALAFNAPGRRDNRSFSISSSDAYAALVENYKSGALAFNAPGRRDNRSFAISTSDTYASLVEKYKTGALVFNAPGRGDDRSFTASADLGLEDAAFLAANPEVMAARRGVPAQEDAAAASTARWVAQGEYYAASNSDFVAANPEMKAYQRYAAQQGCAALGLGC